MGGDVLNRESICHRPACSSTRNFQLTAHHRYGCSRRCLEIISECAIAKSATWSVGYQYLWTLHATLLCLYVLVCSLCRAPAGFVSAMAYRETAIVQDTLSVLGMRCTGLFESYFLLCPDPLTNSKHVSSGVVLPRVITGGSKRSKSPHGSENRSHPNR